MDGRRVFPELVGLLGPDSFITSADLKIAFGEILNEGFVTRTKAK